MERLELLLIFHGRRRSLEVSRSGRGICCAKATVPCDGDMLCQIEEKKTGSSQ
jgi:hypothetical protein